MTQSVSQWASEGERVTFRDAIHIRLLCGSTTTFHEGIVLDLGSGATVRHRNIIRTFNFTVLLRYGKGPGGMKNKNAYSWGI